MSAVWQSRLWIMQVLHFIVSDVLVSRIWGISLYQWWRNSYILGTFCPMPSLSGWYKRCTSGVVSYRRNSHRTSTGVGPNNWEGCQMNLSGLVQQNRSNRSSLNLVIVLRASWEQMSGRLQCPRRSPRLQRTRLRLGRPEQPEIRRTIWVPSARLRYLLARRISWKCLNYLVVFPYDIIWKLPTVKYKALLYVTPMSFSLVNKPPGESNTIPSTH